MTARDPDRMRKLLAQNRLKKRAAALLEGWASHGVSVSPVSHERYWLLLDRLRDGRSWRMLRTLDYAGALRRFVSGADMLTILGWDVSDEPALLISADRLLSNASALASIYPDGFVLISDGAKKALVVDFDVETGTYLDVVDLP